jgi:hypothetical protein
VRKLAVSSVAASFVAHRVISVTSFLPYSVRTSTDQLALGCAMLPPCPPTSTAPKVPVILQSFA